MTNWKEQNCGSCAHYFQTLVNGQPGQCRANPPTVIAIASIVAQPSFDPATGQAGKQQSQQVNIRSMFPPMAADDPGCRKFVEELDED